MRLSSQHRKSHTGYFTAAPVFCKGTPPSFPLVHHFSAMDRMVWHQEFLFFKKQLYWGVIRMPWNSPTESIQFSDFSKFMDWSNHHHDPALEHFYYPTKFPVSIYSPGQPLICFPTLPMCCFWKTPISELIQYVIFWVWHLSCGMFSRSVHTVACVFWWPSGVPPGGYIPHLV